MKTEGKKKSLKEKRDIKKLRGVYKQCLNVVRQHVKKDYTRRLEEKIQDLKKKQYTS